ncbi:MAG TPA: hypothetical protein VK850_09380, partial [Candidatus Binatia bacterium]|nr:hypothetical protein [Candidatus Binatia bacterium]
MKTNSAILGLASTLALTVFRLARIFTLPAMVFTLEAQTPPATNPGVTLPPRVTRTNAPDQAAPAAATPPAQPPPA